ncbi:T9SS type B sorting domain-containing protein [Salegentibacter maritimus]|uniref:T9SS type B sorting domain-containing protein n=1 Tax=Salegentibacter maritimus TaxID=2794347 RepID=UPI0018E40232|nr:gliding motility-associated C-terminal domain-containing protein [Salegentibacter maritimus]MBI6115570.1 gliding motility-associated C-terminal domain-containing protein [Salegentibacter maritimus]
MQNFTFGRKGTNWFLFAFVLLIGTLPSFGQDCPTLDNPNPGVFCYLQDINDLTAVTNPDDTVEWYRDAALTQPIPVSEFLENKTYYAGNPEGDCNNPIAVTVTVEIIPAPVSSYGNVYSPYIGSEGEVRQINDLTTPISTTAGADEIVVYTTEFGTTTYSPGDVLVAGQSYFIGQTDSNSPCYSERIAIRYSPDVAPAPIAESTQTFCEGATVADLEATATSADTQAFRWYSTATSNPALLETDELQPGTYYVSQIVNDEGDPFPPAESEDRTEVTVEIIEFDAGADVSEIFCLSEVEQRLADGESPTNLFLSLVEDRNLPTQVSFSPSIGSIASDFNNNPIQTFTADATFTTEEGCEDTVELKITVEESFEAGDDNIDNTVCRADIGSTATAALVEDYLKSLLSSDADQNGQFYPTPSDIANDLNNTTDEINFGIFYVVGEETFCEDSALLEVTVLEGADFQLVPTPALCNDDIPALVNQIPEDVEALFLENFGSNIPNGAFQSGDIQAVINQYNQNNIGTFTATYIAENGNGCSQPIELERTVIDGQVANAGGFDNIPAVCSNAELIDLTSLTNNDPQATLGGTFSGEGVTNNTFDPSAVTPGIIDITYTVDESINCVEGNDETTFTIEVTQGPNAGNDVIDSICISELEEIVGDYDPQNPNATLIQLFERFDWNGDTDGEFTPNIDILGAQLLNYYTDENRGPELTLSGTYTVGDSQDNCGTDEAAFAITIVDGTLVDAGADNLDNELCNSQIPGLVNSTPGDVEALYFDLLEEGVPQNGTFNPTIPEIIARYNSNNFQTFSTTYTVGTGACSDSVDLAITVIPVTDANAGNIDDQVVCSTDSMVDLMDYLESGAQTTGTFSGNGVQGNMFDPSAGTSEITYTVNGDDECVTEGTEDSTSFTISVVEPGEAIAEAIDDTISVCTSETSYDLFTALSDDTTPGGSFTLNGAAFAGSTFDVTAVDAGEYSFNYTVGSDDVDCIEGQASASFTINVTPNAVDAGADQTASICNENITNGMFPNSTSVRDYYLNLLDEGVSRDGTFSPSIQELVNWYNNESEIGDFTTTYTVNQGECSDSAVLTVTVFDAIDAEVGEIVDQTLCSSDDDLNLYSLITSGNEDGTFEGYEDGVFSPSMMGAGTYEITYTVGEDIPCVEGEASTTFSVEVLQGADAGENLAVNLCTNDETQDLYSLLSAGADMDGEFTLNGEVITNGTMDPSAFDAGVYEVTYTVEAQGDDCGGDDVSTITITLGDAPEAPTTGETLAFCAIDAPTADLLVADGTNLTWYSDADLSMMVSDDDLLVNGDYYVTQTADNGCESEAAVLTVNIVDSPAPTINSDYELCTFDDPTLSDLSDEINEAGTITWYDAADSMTALSNNAMLTDGTTYYATLISDNGCESSERLAVTVTLEDCPLLFPEAITPNGDGKNDNLVIENIAKEYPNYNITIFNRWGNAVYKGNASTPAWDGTSNQSGNLGDDVLPVGVYFYVVDFNDGSTEPRQGKVYLNR